MPRGRLKWADEFLDGDKPEYSTESDHRAECWVALPALDCAEGPGRDACFFGQPLLCPVAAQLTNPRTDQSPPLHIEPCFACSHVSRDCSRKKHPPRPVLPELELYERRQFAIYRGEINA